MNYLLLVQFLNIFLFATAARILFFAAIPSKSHFKLSYSIAKTLVEKGHDLTVVNPYPRKIPIPNYKDVPVTETVTAFEEIRAFLYEKNGFVSNLNGFFHAGIIISDTTLKNSKVQALLKSNKTFDLLIIDQLCTEALFATAKLFDVPIVVISGLGITNLVNYLVGNPLQTAYTWNFLSETCKTKMNFWDRLQNFLLNVYVELQQKYYSLPNQKKIVKKYISSDIDLDNIRNNISLILSNAHATLHDPTPQLPNVINIAGYHIQQSQKLPIDLQNYLDNCTNGFILFGMGSNLQSKDLDAEIQNAILKAFSKIKINILWKYEQNLENLPKNVKIMNWLPQQDILAHPNIRAFITHLGMLSFVETVYFGVPIIGIPVFADQMSNVAAAVTKGYGVRLELKKLTEKSLLWALQEILENSRYRENIKKASELIQDRAIHPLDEAIYWIEYVIRHRGAPHLKSSAVNLKWFERETVDIVLFLVMFLFTISIIFITVGILSFRYFCKSIQSLVTIKKKKD